MPKEANLWENLDEELFLYYKWDNKPTAVIVLEEPIENIDIVTKVGTYGEGKYIAIKCPDEVKLFNITSVKLRKAIIEVIAKNKKYPIKIELTRIGFGKSMDYKAKIIP